MTPEEIADMRKLTEQIARMNEEVEHLAKSISTLTEILDLEMRRTDRLEAALGNRSYPRNGLLR